MTSITAYDSPIGKLTLASDGTNITGLWMEGQKYYGRGLGEGAAEKDFPVFGRARDWLDRYFSGETPDATLPLAPDGRELSALVWQALREIPYGGTTTYGAIAKTLSTSARAVGWAVGHNPISIIIPCHRVLGADGSLTGFAGGLERKSWLLRHEAGRKDAP